MAFLLLLHFYDFYFKVKEFTDLCSAGSLDLETKQMDEAKDKSEHFKWPKTH